MFEEQVVNRVAGRCQVLAFHGRPQVVHQRQFDAVVEGVGDPLSGVDVSSEDDRHAVLAAEPWLGLGRCDHLGDLDDVLSGPAIGATGDQDHVGSQFTNPLDLFVRQPLVVGGDGVHHDRPGPECRSLGTGRGHLADDSGDHHLQPTAGA